VIYNEIQRIKTKGGRINILETVKMMKKRNRDIISCPVSVCGCNVSFGYILTTPNIQNKYKH